MPSFTVTRAHLKSACDEQNWDLLDLLLELDPTHLNDRSLFTDTWGVWWGLLFETVRNRSADGVTVLLKHGAQRDVTTWGDDIEHSALEIARDAPAILALLQAAEPPAYIRKTAHPLPPRDAPDASAINRQGEIRDQAGLVFQPASLKPEKAQRTD